MMEYFISRIKEIYTSVTTDKKLLSDVIIHSLGKKIAGDTFANQYCKMEDDNFIKFSEKDLKQILLYITAVKIMTDNDVKKAYSSKNVINPYLSEALSMVIEEDPSMLNAYSEAKSNFGEDQGLTEPSYVESYFDWIDKNTNYLIDVRSTLRMVSFNELSIVWGKPASSEYLATHYKLRRNRHCDLHRVFVYDKNYMENVELLRQLIIEMVVQSKIEVNVRICSYEQLKEKGKGYHYPLEAFGIYDRYCLGVLIPHPTKSLVHFVHKEKPIKEAIDVYDNIYDSAEPAMLWQKKHKKILNSDDERIISLRIANVRELSNRIKLY